MSEAIATTNHDEIRTWAEKRDGRPALAGGKVLRIDFGEPEDGLEPVEWDEFFRIFDERKLSFLHQEKLEGGKMSRFNKFIER